MADLFYSTQKKHQLRGMDTDATEGVLRGVATSPCLCEQGDSLLCLDAASVCLVCFFPQMSSAVVTLKFRKCLQSVSQRDLLWLSL